MEFVVQGQPKKLESYKAILARAGVTDEEVAYVGDDLPDLPILRTCWACGRRGRCGSGSEARGPLLTTVDGGKGAIREVVELILKSQGRWKRPFRKPSREAALLRKIGCSNVSF